MRSNNNNNDTNRREKERERERPLFPFHAIVKKTILINLIIKQEHKNFSSLLDICFVGFFALVFLLCFEGHVSLKVMKI
jgi:hypothetical protein